MKGKTDRLRTNRFAAKLPINENIWIKKSFVDRVMEGINHGNPVNNFALKNSNKLKKIIVKKIDEWFFFEINLDKTQAKPQKTANIDGKIIIAIGINTLW